jgi:mono/diheme cytochrome c family protein
MEAFMNSFWRFAIPLAVSLLSIGLVGAEKGDAAKGKEVFMSRCSVCHGESGEGKEAIGKMFGVKMPVLGSKEVQSLDDAELKKIISQGKGKMKPVNLSDQELNDVVAFLHTLKK